MGRIRSIALVAFVAGLLACLLATLAFARAESGTVSTGGESGGALTSGKEGFWTTVAMLIKVNNSTFSDDYRTSLFTAKTGKLRIKWHFEKLQKKYTWAAIVFRKGQTPDNSMGSGPILMKEVSPDSGTKDFKVKKGKQYYLWIEVWHVRADVRVFENR